MAKVLKILFVGCLPFTALANEYMPLIKRIGIVPVESNVEEFLSQTTPLQRGILAFPINVPTFQKNLTQLIDEVIKKQGRFWSVIVDLQSAQDAKSIAQQYDLDGFLKTQLIFSTETTAVRMTLHQAHQPDVIWLREDSLGESEPSADDLKEVFLQDLTRIAKNIGHDGRLIQEKDGFAMVDFGSEQALEPGVFLSAGIVQSVFTHPQTHEFLQIQQTKTHDLEVIEAKPGHALCRIIKKDDVIYQKYFKGLYKENTPELLVWKSKDPKPFARLSWGEKLRDHPLFSNNTEGFVNDLPILPVPKDTTLALTKPGDEKSDGKKQAAANSSDHDATPDHVNTPDSSSPTSAKPLNFQVHGFNLGVFSDFGILQTYVGERYTNLPPTILNSFMASLDFRTFKNWKMTPGAGVNFYNGGDVEGVLFFLNVENLIPLADFQDNGLLSGGLGIDYVSGNVDTILVKKQFNDLDFLILLDYSKPIFKFGQSQSTVGLSLKGLVNNSLWGFVSLDLKPQFLNDYNISIFLKFQQTDQDWQEIVMGGIWELLPKEFH